MNTTITSNLSLTDKEQALYEAIQAGMDEAGSGWLHEISPFNNDHVTAGVLGSLISKGLVTSFEDDETPAGFPAAYWVELA